MATGRASPTNLLGIGLTVISVVATTFLGIEEQAAVLIVGFVLVMVGLFHVAWHYRFAWGRRMFGSILLLILAVLGIVGCSAIGLLSIQGIKGSYKLNQTDPNRQNALTPQNLAQALIEAVEVIKAKEETTPVRLLEAKPTPEPPARKGRAKKATPHLKPVAAPATTPLLPAPTDQAPAPVQQPPAVATPVTERHLTQQKQRELIDLLAPLAKLIPRSIVMTTPNDNESYNYGMEFFHVLTRAGLQPSQGNDSPHNKDETGVMMVIQKTTPLATIQKVKAAFAKAGISFKDVNRDSSIDISLIIYVGPNPEE